jgi:hypothetical protein
MALPSNRVNLKVEIGQHNNTACDSALSFFIFSVLHHSLLQGEFYSLFWLSPPLTAGAAWSVLRTGNRDSPSFFHFL